MEEINYVNQFYSDKNGCEFSDLNSALLMGYTEKIELVSIYRDKSNIEKYCFYFRIVFIDYSATEFVIYGIMDEFVAFVNKWLNAGINS